MYDRPYMKQQDWIRYLKAAALVVALLAGPVSASASLATDSSDVCSMSCCVKEGQCCCSPHRALVKGQARSGLPDLSDANIAASCPEDCATSASSTAFHLRDLERPSSHQILSCRTVQTSSNLIPAIQLHDLEHSAPRGPPPSLLTISLSTTSSGGS